MKLTQQERLLEAFKEKGELYVYEIMSPQPQGLGIAQYNARIKELRQQGHPIINTEPGHFIYKSDTAIKEDPMSEMSWQERGQWLKEHRREPLPQPEVRPMEELRKLKPVEMTEEELEICLEQGKKITPTLEGKPEKYNKALNRIIALEDRLLQIRADETLR